MLNKLHILWRLLKRASIKETKSGVFISIDNVTFHIDEGKLSIYATEFINQNATYLFNNCSSEFINSVIEGKESEKEDQKVLTNLDDPSIHTSLTNYENYKNHENYLNNLCLAQQD